MKKVQRILMALAVCSLSIVAVGCSSDEKKNTTTDNTKENSKLSNEELLKKVNEASKSIKNSKAKVTNKTSLDVLGKKTETIFNMDIMVGSDPTIVKVTGNMIALGRTININTYIIEDAVYALDPETNEWFNIKDETTKKAMQSQKNASNLDGMLEMMNALDKNLTVEEKDSEYEITYSGNDDAVKEALKKALSNNQQDLGQVLDNIKLDKLELKYKVDKKTFIPKEYEVKTTIKYPNKDKETVFQMELKVEFSEINEVKGLTIPDEVKNAKEWKRSN